MKEIKGLLLDVDGVISRGGKPIEKAVEGYKLLKEHGIKTVIVSNNSTRSRRFTLERFRNFELDVTEDEIVVATHATAKFIAEEKPRCKSLHHRRRWIKGGAKKRRIEDRRIH